LSWKKVNSGNHRLYWSDVANASLENVRTVICRELVPLTCYEKVSVSWLFNYFPYIDVDFQEYPSQAPIDCYTELLALFQQQGLMKECPDQKNVENIKKVDFGSKAFIYGKDHKCAPSLNSVDPSRFKDQIQEVIFSNSIELSIMKCLKKHRLTPIQLTDVCLWFSSCPVCVTRFLEKQADIVLLSTAQLYQLTYSIHLENKQ